MNARIRNVAWLLWAAAFVVPVAGPSAAAPDSRSRQLAAACASCHSPQSGGTGIPPVVGLAESRIVQSMLAYRSDARAPQIMHVVAAALSSEEVASLAHYLAGRNSASAR